MKFQIFGIPVVMRGSFFILAVFLAVERLNAPLFFAQWIVVVTLSILIHELGHAFAYRYYGSSPSIELHSLGGLTMGNTEKDFPPGQSAVISFAGPLAGFLAGGLVLGIASAFPPPAEPLLRQALSDFFFVNFAWGVINLLPMLPLDGGQLARAFLVSRSPQRGTLHALALSCVVAFLAGLVSYRLHYSWGMLLALIYAIDNGRRWYLFRQYLAAEPFQEKLRAVCENYEADRLEEAERGARELLALSRDPQWQDSGHYLLCLIALKKEDAPGAWLAIREIPPHRITVEMLDAIEGPFRELRDEASVVKITELRNYLIGKR